MNNWKVAMMGGVAGVGLSVAIMLWVQSAMEPSKNAVNVGQNATPQSVLPPDVSGSSSQIPDSAKPHLLSSLEVERYNIVSYRGQFYGIPHGMEVDWSQPPVTGDGVLIEDHLDALERSIAENYARELAASKTTPKLLEANERYRYNVVKYNDKLYALPWGLEVDWAQPPQPTPDNGVLIDDDTLTLMHRIRERVLTHIDWDREGAWIVEAIDDYRYNIVAFEKKLYALPWGLEVDWAQPPVPALENGVFIGADVKKLEERIREHLIETSLQTQRPQLLKMMEAEQYKLYVFDGKFYAVPVGIHMDWLAEGALPAGVLTALTVERLKTLIHLAGAQ